MSLMTRRKAASITALVLAGALACAAAGRAGLYLRPAQDTAMMKEVLMLPPGRVIRQMDLGYHTLAADLLFIRANLYYGEHILTDEQLPWLSHFIDTLLEVDPDFKKAYLWGQLVTLFFKKEIHFVPPEIVARANRILEKGMQRFPEDYRFPMRIGYNYYYELGDADAAIPYFRRAAGLPGAPDWLHSKLFDIYAKKGKRETARLILESMISQTDEPALNQAMKARLASLLDERAREAFVDCWRHITSAWQDKFRFIPLDLFLVIGENDDLSCPRHATRTGSEP